MGRDVLPRVGGEGCSSVTVPLTEVDSIVSPTVSPAPNMDAIQQTLVDTDSEDGTPPVDVISALEADLVGNVAWDPISAVRGPRHQGASRRVALVPQSSQGTPRSIQGRESQPCGSSRLLTRMEDDVGVQGDEGGPTQVSPGVQGLHVVNIADDSALDDVMKPGKNGQS